MPLRNEDGIPPRIHRYMVRSSAQHKVLGVLQGITAGSVEIVGLGSVRGSILAEVSQARDGNRRVEIGIDGRLMEPGDE